MIWEQRIPKIWRQVKIIALAKPGKDPHLAESYRPILLLSICCYLLECTILQKISSTVEDFLSVDQSGFCHGSSTCNQVTALTTFIENGFEKTLKTGAVFLDLTATYTSPLGTLASFINCPSACLSAVFRQWNCCYETVISGSTW